MKVKKKPNHYVDNNELLKAMMSYKKELQKAKKNGIQTPAIPSYIGECIMKISTHLAYRPNFLNYTFRDEMVSDGIENCLKYIENFDHKKSLNPFAYFTQIIFYAFVRRIQKEKKYLYTKYVATSIAEITNMTTGRQEADDSVHKNDLQYGEWTQEQMLRFMEDFERTKRRKKRVIGPTEENTSR